MSRFSRRTLFTAVQSLTFRQMYTAITSRTTQHAPAFVSRRTKDGGPPAVYSRHIQSPFASDENTLVLVPADNARSDLTVQILAIPLDTK